MPVLCSEKAIQSFVCEIINFLKKWSKQGFQQDLFYNYWITKQFIKKFPPDVVYSMEALPTTLSIEQLHETFPSLDKALLREFVQTYRTVPYSNLSIQEKDISLSKTFEETINSERSLTQYTAATSPLIIRIPNENPNKPYHYSGNYTGFRENIYLDLAVSNTRKFNLSRLL